MELGHTWSRDMSLYHAGITYAVIIVPCLRTLIMNSLSSYYWQMLCSGTTCRPCAAMTLGFRIYWHVSHVLHMLPFSPFQFHHILATSTTYNAKSYFRPVKLWFDPKQIATETISPVLIPEIYPEHHIKIII